MITHRIKGESMRPEGYKALPYSECQLTSADEMTGIRNRLLRIHHRGSHHRSLGLIMRNQMVV